MDETTCSPFSHYSWLGDRLQASSDQERRFLSFTQVVHSIHIVLQGRQSVRWISRGQECRWVNDAGSVHFLPADNERHVIGTAALQNCTTFLLLIPQRHLHDISALEGIASCTDFRGLLFHDDAILQSCMTRLASSTPTDDGNAEGRKDEAGRSLVLRLTQLCGGGVPEWQCDTSTFASSTLEHLISHIDAHLRIAPTLSDMALITGLSPSHFAKKFRQSTGFSLHRLINRRRIQASLDLLKAESVPLSHVALDLGFSSQSHFTRLFTDSTGMTPAKYRRQFRRSVS